MNENSSQLLSIQNLEAGFHTRKGDLMALRGVDLEVNEAEIVALVGESGSGKTLTGLSVLNLIENPGFIAGGGIIFKNDNILEYDEKRLLSYRGGDVAMIFQEPMTALNPVFTVGYQIAEVLRTHLGYDKKQAKARAIELLQSVGIPEPSRRVDNYPFQLSGGMRQRAMIAMALATSPALLIADEPTTALDVTIQAQILMLLKNLSREKRTSILLITHDLGIVSQLADRVYIMYAGQVVETGTVKQVLENHKHPYTAGLIGSLPSIEPAVKKGVGNKRLEPIPGQVPALSEISKGCAFKNRCNKAREECSNEIPLKKLSADNGGTDGQRYRCVL